MLPLPYVLSIIADVPLSYIENLFPDPSIILSLSPRLTLLANVVTPATLTLSKFVWPSTSKSPFASMLLENDA